MATQIQKTKKPKYMNDKVSQIFGLHFEQVFFVDYI